MTIDLQGVALVITASASLIAAVAGARAATLSARNGDSIKKVGVDINGRMSQFLATKDELTERRVEGSYKQGVADQKENG